MNPDWYNAEESTTWTLKDSEGNVVSFKVPKHTAVVIRETGEEVRHVDKDLGRQIWAEYVERGFKICDKFQHRPAKESVDKLFKFKTKKLKDMIHENDLQEMRINPKDFYKKAIMEYTNYALEA